MGGISAKFTAISGIHIIKLFWNFFPRGRWAECCEILGMYTELIQYIYAEIFSGGGRGLWGGSEEEVLKIALALPYTITVKTILKLQDFAKAITVQLSNSKYLLNCILFLPK